MMDGEGNVVAGAKNKIQAAVAHVMPAEMLAKQHTKMAAPRSARKQNNKVLIRPLAPFKGGRLCGRSALRFVKALRAEAAEQLLRVRKKIKKEGGG